MAPIASTHVGGGLECDPRRGVLAMTSTLVSELSGYAFSPLREGDFPLYRGSGDRLPPVLLVTAEDTSLVCLKRLEHEYALRAELDVAWAVRPVALSRYRGRSTLVLEELSTLGCVGKGAATRPALPMATRGTGSVCADCDYGRCGRATGP
jgi:hypothetical protein